MFSNGDGFDGRLQERLFFEVFLKALIVAWNVGSLDLFYSLMYEGDIVLKFLFNGLELVVEVCFRGRQFGD